MQPQDTGNIFIENKYQPKISSGLLTLGFVIG